MHVLKSLAIHLRCIVAIKLTLSRLLCELRVHNAYGCIIIRHSLHGQLAQTVTCHRTICMNAMQICARNFFITYHIHSFYNFCQHIIQIFCGPHKHWACRRDSGLFVDVLYVSAYMSTIIFFRSRSALEFPTIISYRPGTTRMVLVLGSHPSKLVRGRGMLSVLLSPGVSSTCL